MRTDPYLGLFLPVTHTQKTEESEDDMVDSDFDASEEDEVRDTDGEDEPRKKRKQWIKPSRPLVVSLLINIL